MKCPKCESENCQIINEVNSEGKDFSVKKACCGIIFFWNIFGLLCGLCGKGKQVKSTQYWVCNNCGNKWKL